MKAGKKETTFRLGIAGKISVKASVHVPVTGKKDESQEPQSVIKDGKGMRSCMLGVAGSVNDSVHVLVKGKKGESPAPEPAIKGKRSCLLDGEKRSVHGKAKGDSWEMEKSKGNQQCPI